MTAPDDILLHLGQQFGFDALRFDASAQLTLRFGSGRCFGFEKIDDGNTLLIFVSSPVDYDIAQRFLDAMKRADASVRATAPAWPVQTMVRQDRQHHHDPDRPALVAMLRLSGDRLTPTKAQQALDFLDDWITTSL